MRKQDLYFVLFEQQKIFNSITNLINREKTKEVQKFSSLNMPIIITGVRRCGKSSLFKILKDTLNLGEKNFLYINFSDERLIEFNINDFQKILDYLKENDYKKCILFLDEIQEVEGWEKWVDRIKSDYRIFISGSNSKLLSKEISTVLTGRSININLFPFNFSEFLNSQKFEIKDWKIDSEKQLKIKKYFLNFLESGGFPQRVISKEKRILSELYENILYRDIIGRFNKNLTKQIKEISLFLLSNISSDVSLRKISSITGIKNISTVSEIIDSLENSFLFFFINKFDYSIKKQIQNPKKVYSIDTGFPNSLGFKFSKDKGKLLENFVAIELKRQNKEIYYYREKQECDFLIKEKLKIKQAIQVCHDMNEDSKEREIKGLIEAMKKFNLKQGLILTLNQEDELFIEKKKIFIKPVWKWLLEN